MIAKTYDYLVVGAGAGGMSFNKVAAPARQEARLSCCWIAWAAGGHWNDAYDFATFINQLVIME